MQPLPGLDRDQTRSRATRVADVTYDLEFDLHAGSDRAAGRVRIGFSLRDEAAAGAPLMLDFEGELTELTVNGHTLEVERVHDHLVLPATALRGGANEVQAIFATEIAATGRPITSYRDAALDEEYLYTLVVPADAHRMFPCFDQPDLKARCRLTLTTPAAWTAVANGAETERATEAGRTRWRFGETQPLSTYLLAFAAGPFAVLPAPAGLQKAAGVPLRLLVRPSRMAELDREALFEMHAQSLRRLGEYFDYAYPFGKLDVVLLPGFPYGGMEHAGAIFYRESALVFDHSPTERELTRRSTLIYHEVSHQWFGNLVSFEWFDDLWLKEGFATFVGYQLMDELEPEREAWLRFHQTVKPGAYRVDSTPGTTPVYQELQNLANAKSAYGAIVYNKAPAVLRQLHEALGADGFRRGLQAFVAEHAFGNARWDDLVQALERATSSDLTRWSTRWILGAGMPRVQVVTERGTDGTLTRATIHQSGALGGDETWPLQLELAVLGADSSRAVSVAMDATSVDVTEAVGPDAAALLLNPNDVAYGLFLPDPKSREWLLERVADWREPLPRAVALTALFDAVREAELHPARYATLAIELLRHERDPQTQGWLLDTLGTTLRRYLAEAERDELAARAAELLLAQLMRGAPGLELQTFRFLARSGHADAVALCEDLLHDRVEIPGLQLGLEDRYRALTALVAAGRDDALVTRLTANVAGDARKYAYLALAARPDAAAKERYFESYLQPTEPPEQWMSQSLSSFHWPGQEALTLPYLRRALERVDWVKAHRKIFFMPAWVDAFINAHSSRAALTEVEDFLAAHGDLAPDIRRKVLQSLDGLRRAVRVRDRWR